MKTLGEGDVIAGKYRVERVLGQGAMGVVVAARHLQLGQRVAIKLLLERPRPEAATRFLREARASVRLQSEHVARVLDVGEVEPGAPYMVMEYLDGSDLKQVLKAGGPLPVEDAVRYVLEACEAIAEAHATGIVHRDLKPANLFLARAADGSSIVKVLDFGISKSIENDLDEGDGLQLTKTSAVLGSPLYMSPEQIKDARCAGLQSDIWSLGVILYQLLTGQVPFRASGFSDLVLLINTSLPAPISVIRADVPPGLDAAVLRCLQRDLAARFATVAELALAIAPYGPPDARSSAEKSLRTLETAGVRVSRTSNGPSMSSRPPAPATLSDRPVSNPGSSAATAISLGRAPDARARSALPALIAAALGLVVVGAGVFLALRAKASPPAHAAPSVLEAPPPPSGTAVLPASAPPPPPPPIVAPSAPVEPAAAAAVAPPPIVTAAPPPPRHSVVTPRATPSAKPVSPAPPQPTQTSKSPLDIKPILD